MLKLIFLIYEFSKRVQNKISNLLFQSLVASVGKGLTVNWPFNGIGYKYMKIGEDFITAPGLRIEAWDEYAGVKHTPEIIIGNNVRLGYNAHIGAISKMKIGNNVLIGSQVLITDHQHGRLTPETLQILAIDRPLFSKGDVTIEDNVWIGENACILDGVTIGKNSVIGCNSVITKDVPPNSVVVGVPGRVVKMIDN
jgi:acetyltransferase-like isoleucine patch superfamily enzyme